MPALIWLGRRWRIAADDFFIPSLWSSLVLLFTWVLLFVYPKFYNCVDISFQGDAPYGWDCKRVTTALKTFIYLLLIIIPLLAFFFLLTGLVSLRGSIFEVSKRRFIYILLYIDSLGVGAMLVVIILCFKYILYDKGLDPMMNGAKLVVLFSLSLDLFLVFAYLAFFFVAFDSWGRRTYGSFEEYERAWAKRLSCLCGCLIPCREKGMRYEAVARTFAQAFGAYDIVPSDIAAGLVLLHNQQKHSRRVAFRPLSYPSAGDGWTETVSYKARAVPKLTAAQREALRELNDYHPYFQAILGWCYYGRKDCGVGLCQLWARDCCCCCHTPAARYYGVRSNCDYMVLHAISHLTEEDILLANWTNGPFQPVHYVAYDAGQHAVLIAIRGTMSIADVVTDLTADPCTLALADAPLPASEYYVHEGMMKGAEFIYEFLEDRGVLEAIEYGRYADAKIRVLGHSLGAGVALLLTVVLWSRRRGLRGRLRGLAYAPPGGLMSAAVGAYCREFTLGCFLGADLVPRLAPHTFEALRESLLDVLATCRLPKTLVWVPLARRMRGMEEFHPASQGATAGENVSESVSYREALRTSLCAHENDERRLYPCEILVHLQKVVVRTHSRGGRIHNGRRQRRREVIYIPHFVGPSEVQTLYVSSSMFSDHMPDRLSDVLSLTTKRMNAGQLERFYVDKQENVPEESIPLMYANLHPNGAV
ncbi:unnamed protein product [Phytomonas sp. Hart1]|nr:unnamed protein product [Phytomonas sp. Hart1]|eukprot:CCW69133.1 unnamed protein product [Phytomonas sp. isolate Hart1]